MPRILVLLLTIATLSVTGWSRPAAAVEVLSGDETVVVLEAGQGQLLRFERPVLRALLADPAIASAQIDDISTSEQLLWVAGLQAGDTNLLIIDYNEELMASVRLIVRQNLDPVTRAIRAVTEEETVGVTPVGNDTLILTGSLDSPDQVDDIATIAEEFITEGNLIDRTRISGPNQINLRIQVAEVSRTATRALGLDLTATVDAGDLGIVFSSLLGPIPGGLVDGSFTGNGNSVQAILDALQTEDLALIMAEPNLTTVSGREASFFVGDEVPVLELDDEGNVAVRFEQVGVSVGFTPTLISGGRINIQVQVNVREQGESFDLVITSAPTFQTRQALTTIELGSGQSFAIAGLFQSIQQFDTQSTPGLSELPLIGPMFRSEDYQTDETELVVFVTPYLVEPVDRQDIALPNQRLSTPQETAVDDLLLRQLPEPAGLTGPAAVPNLAGGRRGVSAGFILN